MNRFLKRVLRRINKNTKIMGVLMKKLKRKQTPTYYLNHEKSTPQNKQKYKNYKNTHEKIKQKANSNKLLKSWNYSSFMLKCTRGIKKT